MKSILNYFQKIKKDKKKSLIIFDLDNTIFDENIFIFIVFKKISNFIGKKYLINQNIINSFLKKNFSKGKRKNLIQSLFGKFNLVNKNELKKLISFYRNKKFSLKDKKKFEYFPYVKQLINLNNFEKMIITNGNVIQQKIKINLLFSKKEKKKFIKIIYANLYKSKPSNLSFIKNIKKNDYERIFYIGDNKIDMQFSKNCKIEFINLNFKRSKNGLILKKSINFDLINLKKLS